MGKAPLHVLHTFKYEWPAGHRLPGQGIAARSIIGIGRFYGKAGTRRIKERLERKTRIRPGRYQHLGRACHIHRLGDPEPGI